MDNYITASYCYDCYVISWDKNMYNIGTCYNEFEEKINRTTLSNTNSGMKTRGPKKTKLPLNFCKNDIPISLVN